MWVYEKKLQYPVKIKNTNAQLAKFIISQYGGAYPNVRVSLTNASKIRILGTFRLFLLL